MDFVFNDTHQFIYVHIVFPKSTRNEEHKTEYLLRNNTKYCNTYNEDTCSRVPFNDKCLKG